MENLSPSELKQLIESFAIEKAEDCGYQIILTKMKTYNSYPAEYGMSLKFKRIESTD